ncbi:hypothetical protein IWQ47_005270 [Aquimarina sp. EL_43]|uniref:hypothetical protein n=1 Tax=unclassified Aquimarina TaxID=2627091 RepID=UPI0018C9B41B|nr:MULTISPECIES: hypothetical protein [unclassified Aquimarina]MBG6133778.1 hypothetical protein [Aquimarina sp. EL_35]MBG6153935.1 hypothetical protein [Aquimarina sp. EL_32]MBG6172171.1 hypothetical protein [Aquimarina sp. EL_43]
MKDYNKNAFPQLAFRLTFSHLTLQEKKKKGKLSRKKLILSSNSSLVTKNYQEIPQDYPTVYIGNTYPGIGNLSTCS